MTGDERRAGALRAGVLRELLVAPAGPLGGSSTNDDVVRGLRADPAAWPDAGLLVADHQDAGRGRAGRGWQTPAGTALTCSFVTRPTVPPSSLGWAPLLAGLGVVAALRATAGVPATLKWPNDLLLPAPAGAPELDGWGHDRKVGGILCELVPLADGPDALVVGVGLNVAQGADELPVPHATSLRVAGARDVDRESLLVALVHGLHGIAARWREAGGDAVAAGLHDEVSAVCATLGRRVRVERPGGEVAQGVADALGPDGSLLLRGDDGAPITILAGDVGHVRGVP